MFYLIIFIILSGCSIKETFDCDASYFEIDSETFDDTGYHDVVCNPETMDYDTEDYQYNNYPPGPYGFKETICWHIDGGVLISDGDTIHNICLPSTEDKTICLNDLGKDKIIFVHIVDMGMLSFHTGQAINYSSDIIKEKCSFNTTFVSIIVSSGSNPIQADALKWKERTGTKYPVLFDLNGIWKERIIKDQWPSAYTRESLPIVFAVNQKDMKIWNTFIGWDFRYNMFSDDWYNFVCDTLSPIAMDYSKMTGEKFVY
jgi:hypothetical protein